MESKQTDKTNKTYGYQILQFFPQHAMKSSTQYIAVDTKKDDLIEILVGLY